MKGKVRSEKWMTGYRKVVIVRDGGLRYWNLFYQLLLA